jgi:hypothetical protein
MNSLQRLKASAQLPGKFQFHPDPDGNVRFPDPVAVLTNRSEGNSHDTVFLGYFRDEVAEDRSGPVIEDDQNVLAVSGFADCSHHFARAPL